MLQIHGIQSNKYHPTIRSSSHENFTEPQNHRIQKFAGLSTYIRMNSHICNWSPFFRGAIDWRRRRINRQPGTEFMDTHPRKLTIDSSPGRYSWIQRDAIHVCSETEKIVWHCVSSLSDVLESDSLVKLAIRWDQSPRNWHRRPKKFGAGPRGWSIQWCHRDITISILCDVPL